MQTQDTERAQQLLEEAGAMGTEVRLIIWQEEPWRQMAEVVQGMMDNIGVEVDLQVCEQGTFFGLILEEGSGFDAFVLGWSGLTDPDQYLFPQFSTGGTWNWIGYSNSELDEILEESRRVVDRSKRKELISQAQEIIAEEAAYACLASQKDFQASRDYVKGYEMPPTGTYRFENVYLDR
jgi:peptide/nickel transport system substrate-binding protein